MKLNNERFNLSGFVCLNLEISSIWKVYGGYPFFLRMHLFSDLDTCKHQCCWCLSQCLQRVYRTWSKLYRINKTLKEQLFLNVKQNFVLSKEDNDSIYFILLTDTLYVQKLDRKLVKYETIAFQKCVRICCRQCLHKQNVV